MSAPARPLEGRTVVITRPREDASELVAGVERWGGRVILCPAISIEFVDQSLLAERIGPLGDYTWVILTSTNALRAVEFLLGGGAYTGSVAVVGRRTAREAERVGLTIAAQPRESTGAALAALLAERLSPGERVLLPRSNLARGDLTERLARAGVEVCAVEAYRTVCGDREAAGELRRFLHGGVPDAVLFASPSSVKGLTGALGEEDARRLLRETAVFSIGPSTTAEVRCAGHEVAGEADPHDAGGLLETLARFFGKG